VPINCENSKKFGHFQSDESKYNFVREFQIQSVNQSINQSVSQSIIQPFIAQISKMHKGKNNAMRAAEQSLKALAAALKRNENKFLKIYCLMNMYH